jgi:hypothetical protein
LTAKAATSRKEIWQSIFVRRGGNGAHTRLFESLESSVRDFLLREANTTESELPVVGHFLDADNWSLLTTSGLVWCTGGARGQLSIEAVRDAVSDLPKLQETGTTKLEMRELRILTFNGPDSLVSFEPGIPLSGVWNILKNAGASNRSRMSRSGSDLD